MGKRALGFILIFLFIAAFVVHGETAAVPRKLAMFLVFTGNIAEDEKTALSETLLAKISEIGSITVVEPILKSNKDITYQEKSDKSTVLGADCYLTITITGQKDKIVLSFLSFDILQNKVAIEEKNITKERELRSLDRSFWQPVISELASNYHPISGDLVIKEITKHTEKETVVQETKGIKVVIVAQPHTTIEGLGTERYTADDDGVIKIELTGTTTYELYATCSGFYPVRKQIYIGSEPVRIELDQNPGSMFAVDVYLQQADYLGAGFRYYYITNKFFVDLKTTLYLWKLIWPAPGDKSRYEAPLVHLSLLTGLYINNEDALFRFSVSSGLFLRIVYIDPLGIILDPISGIGITLASCNVEISTFDKYRFFFEYNLNFYFSDNVNFFKASVTGENSGSNTSVGYVFLGHGIFDFLDFKIGVRIQL